jgi:hypothetical protein
MSVSALERSVSTDLPVNRESPKGVPIFGKSVIRAICRESAMCGCQGATGAMPLVLRCGVKLAAAEKLDAAERREADAAGWWYCG